MNRRQFINLHLYTAAFFAPVILVIAMSGLLYLLDIKGETLDSEVYRGSSTEINLSSDRREDEVKQFLSDLGIEYSFDYLRGSESSVITRPTSRTFYDIRKIDGQVIVTQKKPDLIYSIIELHKGHGPTLFRYFQHAVAVGLLFIVLTGFWLGITSPVLKKATTMVTAAGIAVFALLLIV